MRPNKIISSNAESLKRVSRTRAEVAAGVDTGTLARPIGDLIRPNSISKTMRKVGIALLASPDIISDVPGAALVATSYVIKNKDPTSLGQLALETKKILRDIQSISL